MIPRIIGQAYLVPPIRRALSGPMVLNWVTSTGWREHLAMEVVRTVYRCALTTDCGQTYDVTTDAAFFARYHKVTLNTMFFL